MIESAVRRLPQAGAAVVIALLALSIDSSAHAANSNSGSSSCPDTWTVQTRSHGYGSHTHRQTAGGTNFYKSFYTSTAASKYWNKGFRVAGWYVYVDYVNSSGPGGGTCIR